jgi:hypothetical protein
VTKTAPTALARSDDDLLMGSSIFIIDHRACEEKEGKVGSAAAAADAG